MPNFQDTLNQHEKLLHKLAHKLHRNFLKHLYYDEVFNIVLISAWIAYKNREENKKLKGEYDWSFGAYLPGTIRNVIKTYHKEYLPTKIYSNRPVMQEDTTQITDIQDLIQSALNILDTQELSVIKLRTYENKNKTECAKQLQLSLQQVSQIEERALKKLRYYVERQNN